jgi:2-polyprenyl-3-methyl-5-hydroxy-6-metoxy-1,4-benzoquinol methylase
LKINQSVIHNELKVNGWLKNNQNIWVNPEQSNKYNVSWPSDSYDENTYKENFWSKARANLIKKVCVDFKIDHIFEVGSGNGNVAIPLTKEGIEVIALEPILSGAQITANFGVITINGTLESIKDLNLTFSTIGTFDVLEHIENPQDFINKIRIKLESGGILILTVPAHNWLYSDFDEAVGHYKRYSKKMLRNEMKSAGFTEIYIRHFFLTLVFPAFFFRRIPFLFGRRRKFSGENGVKKELEGASNLNRALNNLFYEVLRLETRFKFPLGLSILGVFRKI